MTTTVSATFNPSQLPAWTAQHPAVVARCENNYAFRCDVCAAKTAAMKKVLIATANRLANH
jgi:hypothetical protein